jgi:hypothetical protein
MTKALTAALAAVTLIALTAGAIAGTKKKCPEGYVYVPEIGKCVLKSGS